MNYYHLLICTNPAFVPAAEKLCDFILGAIEMGTLPGEVKLRVSVPSGEFREMFNPLTGNIDRFEKRTHKDFQSLDKVRDFLNTKSDFEFSVEGSGRPQAPPLPLEFEDDYSILLRAFIWPEPVVNAIQSGSWDINPLDFRKAAAGDETTGVFTHPVSGQPIKVPGSRKSRFCLEWELGEQLCPTLPVDSFDVLQPQLIALAEKIFGEKFVQAAWWG